MLKKRLVVLNVNLEKSEKLRAPLDTPPTGLLRLPSEIRLRIYHYCIPRKRITVRCKIWLPLSRFFSSPVGPGAANNKLTNSSEASYKGTKVTTSDHF